MSENGEIYTIGKKIYTAAGSDGSDKSHLWDGLYKKVGGQIGKLIHSISMVVPKFPQTVGPPTIVLGRNSVKLNYELSSCDLKISNVEGWRIIHWFRVIPRLMGAWHVILSFHHFLKDYVRKHMHLWLDAFVLCSEITVWSQASFVFNTTQNIKYKEGLKK